MQRKEIAEKISSRFSLILWAYYHYCRIYVKTYSKINPAKCHEMLRDCIGKLRKYDESNSQALATLYMDYGYFNRKENKWKESLDWLEASLRVFKALYPKGSEDVINVLNELGNLYWEMNKLIEAFDYYNESLIYCELIYKDPHKNIARAKHNIGIILKENGQYEEAIKLFNQAKDMYLNLNNGVPDQDVGFVQRNLAMAFLQTGKIDEAEKLADETLELFEGYTRSNESEPIALTMNTIGACKRAKGECTEALDLHIRAMCIFIEIYGKYHIRVGHSLYQIAEDRLAMGQKRNAKYLFLKVINLYHEIEEKNECDLSINIERVKTRIKEIISRNGDSNG